MSVSVLTRCLHTELDGKRCRYPAEKSGRYRYHCWRHLPFPIPKPEPAWYRKLWDFRFSETEPWHGSLWHYRISAIVWFFMLIPVHVSLLQLDLQDLTVMYQNSVTDLGRWNFVLTSFLTSASGFALTLLALVGMCVPKHGLLDYRIIRMLVVLSLVYFALLILNGFALVLWLGSPGWDAVIKGAPLVFITLFSLATVIVPLLARNVQPGSTRYYFYAHTYYACTAGIAITLFIASTITFQSAPAYSLVLMFLGGALGGGAVRESIQTLGGNTHETFNRYVAALGSSPRIVSAQPSDRDGVAALGAAMDAYSKLGPIEQEAFSAYIIRTRRRPSFLERCWAAVRALLVIAVGTICAQEPAIALLKWVLTFFDK